MYTKQDLIKQLTGLQGTEIGFQTKTEAERAVNLVLDGIKAMVSKDDSGINLVGFGAFRKVNRPARQGRNPATGEPIQISVSNSVAFKISKPFKDSLNN